MMINPDAYLSTLKEQLLDASNWKPITLTRQWAKGIPPDSGVYVLKDQKTIVYVGETGNLAKRMADFLDSRHHSARRSLGERHYSDTKGFKKATTTKKFPEQIEDLLNNYISLNIVLAYLTVPIGRKELEEFIEKDIDLKSKLNKRGKRKK